MPANRTMWVEVLSAFACAMYGKVCAMCATSGGRPNVVSALPLLGTCRYPPHEAIGRHERCDPHGC